MQLILETVFTITFFFWLVYNIYIKWLTMFFLNEMTFVSHLSSTGEAPEMRDD